jgi:hypothetical protein
MTEKNEPIKRVQGIALHFFTEDRNEEESNPF